MTTLTDLFGAQVRHYRTKAGFSQTDLAERVGVTTEMIGKIERGTSGTSFSTIDKLCRELRVPPNALFPAQELSEINDRGPLGDLVTKLSKLNEEELEWISKLLMEALAHP